MIRYATYSNGTRTYYEYENAERMTRMRHELADGSDCFKDVSYTYYANGWLATIFEQFTARGGGDRGSVHGVETQEDWVCGPVHEGGR